VSNASISGNTSGHGKNSNGRGSIYPIKLKSGATRYRAAIHDINRKRRTKNFKKKAEAEDWLAMQRQSRNHGLNTYATNPKMTVGVYLLEWVESHKRIVKHSTYKSYKSCIRNQINPGIGKQIASNLTTKAIENFYGDLVANQIGGGTLNLVHRTLSCAFGDAVRLGDLPRNPVLNARKPNIKSVPTKAIPPEHWKKIYLEAMKNPFAHARIEIGLMIGLRPGEVLGLKWDDIDYETKTLTIERQVQRGASGSLEFQSVKQGQIRTVPLTRAQINILLSHKRYQALNKAKWTIDENLVFPNSIGGKLDEKKDRAEFKKLLEAAGVPDYQLYQLRKTAFTNMAQQTDVRTLQAFSGHSQVSTLMGSYVFPTEESMLRAVSGMDNLRPVNIDD
jgi:integrase